MNIINAENLTKSYTERKLLDKASFYLQEGEKVGVIGINGTGKSTLLKIIAGLEEPDEGQVTCSQPYRGKIPAAESGVRSGDDGT